MGPANQTELEASRLLDVEICDAHIHLADNDDNARAFPERYLLDNLRSDIASVGGKVTKVVYAECTSRYALDCPPELAPVGETKWVCQQDPQAQLIAGIVGHADLTLGTAVGDVVAAHIEAASENRFSGVRHSTAWDASPEITLSYKSPDPGILGTTAFGDGARELAKLGVTFDAFMHFTQLGELVPFAHAHPDLTIVLGHMGGFLGVGPYAGQRDEVVAEWGRRIAEVARCENVVLKLGGLGRPKLGFAWGTGEARADSAEVHRVWRDPVARCLDLFGVNRCMVESNFPVDGIAMTYATFWDAVARLTDDLTRAERKTLFHDTAVRVYGLSGG